MSQAMHSFSNPYIAGDPVGKTPAFVGRDDVLREVLRVLRHPQQNAITLYGQRRIGKTSILQWLEAHLPEEGPYRPVYLDLMNYSAQPLDVLLRNLASGIARALGRPRSVPEGDIRESFREQFIPQMLAALPQEIALVLLMDEFDVQADPDADRETKQAFFSYMRNLRQVFPHRLQFVFALGRTIDDLDIVARGLFKDLPSKRVSLLSREDTEHLIRLAERQGLLRWTQPAVEAIWGLTHGHPYLVQALCAEVWETLHEGWEGEGVPGAYKADVEAAVEPVLERSAHMFAWIWEGLGPAEKVAAATLAEAGPGPVSEDRLEAILAESGVRILIRELRDAPRQLQAWDILERVEEGYRFRVELLRRWIADRHPLGRTQDELDRINPVADNFYQAGRGLYEGGDLEGARDTLERALGLNPSHQSALELLGEIALAQGDLGAAQKALEALLELSPRRARERLVQIYLRRGEEAPDDKEQEQWYRRALEIAPEHSAVQERLMQVYLRRAEKASDDREWEKWYRQAREVAPDSPQVQETLQAFKAAHRAAILQSEHEAILQLEQKGQYHAALERAEALREQYPEADFLPALLKRLKRKTRLAGLFQDAKTALEKGNPDAAIPALQEIIALEPTYRDGEAAALLHRAVRATLRSKLLVANAPARLSPWNPLDYLRLLFWVFFDRARLHAYREAYGEDAEKSVGNRLALTLAFWPLLWPALGLGLGLLPRAESAWSASTYLELTLGMGGAWLFFIAFANGLGKQEVTYVVPAIVALVVAGGVAGSVAGSVAVVVAVVVALVVAVVVAVVVDEDAGGKFWMVWLGSSALLSALTGGIIQALTGGTFGDGAWAGIVGVVTFVVAFVVAGGVAVGVAVGVAAVVDKGSSVLRALLGALGLAVLLALSFLSLGGWVWLQTGHWPVPVWPW